MKRPTLIALRFSAAGVAFWLLAACSGARDVSFVSVRREALVSTVQTNGKVEPIQWEAVRAARAGLVTGIRVERGESVRQGAVIAELEADTARAQLAAARASFDQAKAELDLLTQGGSPAELAAIDASLASARFELESAGKDASALGRLADKQAATRQELLLAEDRVRKAQLEVSSLEKRRAALVSPPERAGAEARMQAADADADEANRRLESAVAHASIAGTVYNVAVRKGSYVQAGDLLAEIGRLDQVRVILYVDEPELGRIQDGMPVTITWDALPEREWKGTVDKLPTEIVALGTRQVGEVIGVIENTDLELPVGANINAELHTELSENALTIPKQALHQRESQQGVYVLSGDTVQWRPVKLGTANITHAAVLDGLSEGDAVALPAEPPLTDSERVNPILR